MPRGLMLECSQEAVLYFSDSKTPRGDFKIYAYLMLKTIGALFNTICFWDELQEGTFRC